VILGVGTVALDTVETPTGSAREVPGGSALYFAAAASILGPVAIVGVTGADFPAEPLARLAARGVNVSGILRLPHPTFRWHARYDESGGREIVSVHRGAIVRTAPVVPTALRNPEILFLGSTDPAVQGQVLRQAGATGRVVLDTMPHWIEGARDVLEALLPRVDVLLVNEEELRLLGGASDEATAAGAVRSLGPTWVVVKRGRRGARAYGEGGCVEVDAVAVERVVDPTGAGDAFAGGLVASLAGSPSLSGADMRAALKVGSGMGARAVSAFSFQGLLESGRAGGVVPSPPR
jgi:sugar/nucleoside kinase (ribokinase family)